MCTHMGICTLTHKLLAQPLHTVIVVRGVNTTRLQLEMHKFTSGVHNAVGSSTVGN
jgi:hypothetical protein